MNKDFHLFDVNLPLEINSFIHVSFNKFNNNIISLSTWNNTIELFDSEDGTNKHSYKFSAPQLKNLWIDKDNVISGGADGSINQNSVFRGAHDAPISSLTYINERNILISTSYDGVIKLWDVNGFYNINTFNVPHKVIDSCVVNNNIIICACSSSKIVEFDIKNPHGNVTDSFLKYNLSCIASYSRYLALGSVESRIGIENLESRKKYSFKSHCNRETKYIYPIHTMSFQESTGYLASGGGDKKVFLWDIENQRQLCEFGPFLESVVSLDFSASGDQLVVASSYGFERGKLSTGSESQLTIIKKT